MDPLTGALIGVGGSLVTGILNNSAASARQSDAQGFSAEQYATRYQTTVADMKAAGLSPMLAYGQGASGAPSSSAASSPGTPDLGASFNQARMASAQVANVQADTSNKEAQADLIRAQTSQATASAGESAARTEMVTNQAKEIFQRLEQDLPSKEAARIQSITTQAYGDYVLKMKQGLTEDQRQHLVNFQAEKVSKEIQALGLSMPEREALSRFFSTEIGKNSPMARFLMEMGEGVSGLILPWKKLPGKGGWSETHRSDSRGNRSSTTTEWGSD